MAFKGAEIDFFIVVLMLSGLTSFGKFCVLNKQSARNHHQYTPTILEIWPDFLYYRIRNV